MEEIYQDYTNLSKEYFRLIEELEQSRYLVKECGEFILEFLDKTENSQSLPEKIELRRKAMNLHYECCPEFYEN